MLMYNLLEGQTNISNVLLLERLACAALLLWNSKSFFVLFCLKHINANEIFYCQHDDDVYINLKDYILSETFFLIK